MGEQAIQRAGIHNEAHDQNTPANRALKLKQNNEHLKKRTNEEIHNLIAWLRSQLIMGIGDEEILEQGVLNRSELYALKKELADQERVKWIGKSNEDMFVSYVQEQKVGVYHLDQLIKRCLTDTTGPINGGMGTAIVGAIKARADIHDNIIKKGQEFGVIEKTPEKKQIFGGLLVTNMDNATLRTLVEKEIRGMASTINKYGEIDMFGHPVQLDNKVIDSPQDSVPETTGPKFTADNKPGFAHGGLAKVAGANASRPNQKPTRASSSNKNK